jgi:hypothetical protein
MLVPYTKWATYWNSFRHVTICNIIYSTINNEYEDSVLLCHTYSAIAFIIWFKSVSILYFFSLSLPSSRQFPTSHPLFLQSAITCCITKAVLIHRVRKAITGESCFYSANNATTIAWNSSWEPCTRPPRSKPGAHCISMQLHGNEEQKLPGSKKNEIQVDLSTYYPSKW